MIEEPRFPGLFRYFLETLLPLYRNIGHSDYLRVGLGVSSVSRRRRRIIAVPRDEEWLVRRYGDMAIWLANLGLVWVFLPAAVALLTGLTLTRRYADAAMLMGGLAVIGIGNGLRVIVDRPRPDNALLESSPSSLSFPSGHLLLAVIVGGVLVYLVGLWVKPLLLRRSLQAGLVLVVIGMGASRAYLRLHWPSDVSAAPTCWE